MNVAIKVKGERPIGAKARKIEEPVIRLSTSSSFNHTEKYRNVVCRSRKDFADFADPAVPCALLKACLVYIGIVELKKEDSTLAQGLGESFGDEEGGIEVHAWSSLPQGTGLGSSSILAGTILQVLACLMGKRYDLSSLVHAVLQVEQIFTTGGGWQDNVGGFVPGVKLCESRASLPLTVTWSPIALDPTFLTFLESRLLMVYTGHTRLAKNLLQNVLGHWSQRTQSVVDTFDALANEAEEIAYAFKQGSLSEVGRLFTSYFDHKRFLSSTTLDDPPAVRKVVDVIVDDAYGYALAGAGGGGFLAVILKEDADRSDVIRRLKERLGGADDLVWEVQVDHEGLTVEIEA